VYAGSVLAATVAGVVMNQNTAKAMIASATTRIASLRSIDAPFLQAPSERIPFGSNRDALQPL
jgi:hypothetical protein